ncbi:MAG: glycoside hydrolase family 3 C-terminal domain-containing protein [Bacteroidales bacterium]|nr:glycoside hydrolase family 3 C-terminal domain-containing protein [Bacteroidales bacterium]
MKNALLVIASALVLSACGDKTPQPQNGLSDEVIEQRINEIMPQLSLDEKVKLCHAQSKFSVPGVARLGIPELWMSDGPHGVRAEFEWDTWNYAGWTNDSCTAFPALTALASTFNPNLAHDFGHALGEECLYRGKNVILGPGVNIYRTPLNGRNFEYMGEDPFLASTLVVPYIKGVQENGVATCVKHYALNNQEVWRGNVDVEVSERALREIYLPAFKAAVTEGHTWSIMGSYNRYLGQHCCHNKTLLVDILKDEWQFDGAVVTDWGGAHNTQEAAYNGLDIEMGTWTNGLTAGTRNAYDNYYLGVPFLNAIKSGEIPESVLDEKVRRVLRLMLRTSMNPYRKPGSLGSEEHCQTALNVAREAIVLLKNDNHILPLDPNTTKKIAVIGENATRSMCKAGGSSELKPKFEISPLEGLKKAFPNANITYSMGYAGGPSMYGRVFPPSINTDSLFKAAVATAADADLVIFVGGLNKSHQQDCEDGDRQSLDLPFGQNELIEKIAEVNPNIVTVFISGNAYAMPWIEKVPAIVQAWYLGSEAGQAIADVLCGEVNPSGKLPISFPVRLEDNAVHSFGEDIVYPGVEDGNQWLHKETYKEDILVGYRWHDTKGIKPLFAFGYGLSYTSFEISNLDYSTMKSTIKKLNQPEKTTYVFRITAKVKNTGDCSGSEVVQVYVGKKDSNVERAAKELKGFQKVFLNPGEEKTVEINLSSEKMKYFDVDQHDWVLESGDYEIYIGNSSDNFQEMSVRID